LFTEVLGWTCSLILLLTIAKQIHKQWSDNSSAGVSKWLFIGQITASCGFTAYSFLVRNWVFVVTNALMALSAVLGLSIVFLHRRRGDKGSSCGNRQD
jgi:MtN3 and saliva related transmembrane protein